MAPPPLDSFAEEMMISLKSQENDTAHLREQFSKGPLASYAQFQAPALKSLPISEARVPPPTPAPKMAPDQPVVAKRRVRAPRGKLSEKPAKASRKKPAKPAEAIRNDPAEPSEFKWDINPPASTPVPEVIMAPARPAFAKRRVKPTRRKEPEEPETTARAKFDATRLPVFYKCYIEDCEVLGRTPEAILKHWRFDFDPAEKLVCGNPSHCGHAWDMNSVYKFIRDKNGVDVKVTTHGKSPELPDAEMLDPKNIKQYLPPLASTNVLRIKVRSTVFESPEYSTQNPLTIDNDVWSCTLCWIPIGSLGLTMEHVAHCHEFLNMAHNVEAKKIFYLAAHAHPDGKAECFVRENGEECDYVGEQILMHMEEIHGLLDEDLLANEETGRIFLTIAEVWK